jgi:hypothetical protein
MFAEATLWLVVLTMLAMPPMPPAPGPLLEPPPVPPPVPSVHVTTVSPMATIAAAGAIQASCARSSAPQLGQCVSESLAWHAHDAHTIKRVSGGMTGWSHAGREGST